MYKGTMYNVQCTITNDQSDTLPHTEGVFVVPSDAACYAFPRIYVRTFVQIDMAFPLKIPINFFFYRKSLAYFKFLW